jgi:periplasmic divalent cation tolerance protein
MLSIQITGVRAVNEFIQVLTTTETPEDARRIADELLQRRLAGCVQIRGPMESLYWWKGKIETSQEWLCLAKTSRSRYDELERVIKDIHPYETPEILAVPVVAGSREYLAWLDAELNA